MVPKIVDALTKHIMNPKIIKLTEDNFLIFCQQNYFNSQCAGKNEFVDDLKRIKYIKRLIQKIHKHKTLITAGGMASLDLVINSLGDKNFYIPYFHWGSWNKLLKIHDKKIFTYDEFNLD